MRGQRRSRDNARRPPPARPAAEALEGRTLLSFSAPVTSAGENVLAVGDFNRDGRDDLVVVGAIVSNVRTASDTTLYDADLGGSPTVRLSNGDGSFRSGVALGGAAGDHLAGVDATAASAAPLRVADVNGDGRPDVVLTTLGQNYTTVRNALGGTYRVYPGFVNVWLGKGDGTFGAVTTTTFQSSSYFGRSIVNPRLTTANFDRDGRADRATVDGVSGVVTVTRAKAGGKYQAPQAFAAGPGAAGYVAAGDFNGDGRADLIVINAWSSAQPTISVLLNDGIW